MKKNAKLSSVLSISARRPFWVMAGILVLLVLLAAFLRYGNPQWHRYIYMYQVPRHTGGIISPPADFSGRWRMWDASGHLRLEAIVRDGVYHGTCTQWREDGTKVFEWEVQHGIRHGKIVSWWPGGEKEVGQFVNGMADGPWTVYDKNGDVASIRHFERNTVLREEKAPPNPRMEPDAARPSEGDADDIE